MFRPLWLSCARAKVAGQLVAALPPYLRLFGLSSGQRERLAVVASIVQFVVAVVLLPHEFFARQILGRKLRQRWRRKRTRDSGGQISDSSSPPPISLIRQTDGRTQNARPGELERAICVH